MIRSTYGSTLFTALFSNAAFPTTAAPYIGLFTVAPSDSSNGTELTPGGANNYDRVAVDGLFTVSGNSVTNTAGSQEIVFPECKVTPWGNIVAWGRFVHATTGNITVGGLITSTAIGVGDVARFAPDTLRCSWV